MAGDSYQELPRAKRRRLIVRAVLRSVVFATVLVVLYYVLLPLDRPLSADAAIRLVFDVNDLTRQRPARGNGSPG